MKRILLIALAVCLLLAGCRSKPEQARDAAPETETAAAAPMVSLYDLRVAMLAAQPDLPQMLNVSSSDENAAELFAYLSDLDYDKVEGYFLSYAADGKTANEFAVVCLKDAADVPALEVSLRTHIKGRVELYRTYAPDQAEQAAAAELAVQDRYVALIMCADQAAVKAAFTAGIQ